MRPEPIEWDLQATGTVKPAKREYIQTLLAYIEADFETAVKEMPYATRRQVLEVDALRVGALRTMVLLRKALGV